MHQYCHRCGGELSSGSEVTPFCPHCGAPQLYLQNHETPAQAAESASAPLPPTQIIDWKTAISCSALVGAVAALLAVLGMRFSAVSFLSTLWILSASITTISFYQRRRPQAKMDARVGARIGLATGFALVVFLAVALAAAGVVARFAFHASGGFDAQVTQILQQTSVQLSHTAAGNPELPALLSLISSPEFRAGYALFSLALLGGFLLILSVLGGAFAGLLRTRRTTTP